MTELTFVTANGIKLMAAAEIGKQFDITFVPATLDIDEIQAKDGETIAKHKAIQAYGMLQKPLIVSDDVWIIPGLNGFPGPYMRYMNEWLSADDYLRLTEPLADRRIILRQVIVYQDDTQQKTFAVDIEGILLKEIRGTSSNGQMCITSFDGGQHSAAELNVTGKSSIGERETSWHQLCAWLKAST